MKKLVVLLVVVVLLLTLSVPAFAAGPLGPGGLPEAHGVDGATLGAVASGMAQCDPVGLAMHKVSFFKP